MIFFFRKTSAASHTPLYASYDAALEASGGSGYQESDIVKMVVEKNVIFRDRLKSSGTIGLDALRMMIGIGALSAKQRLSILDFGGGGGSHHTIATTVLGKDRDIRWNVVETTAMAFEANKRMAANGLKFFDSIDQAQQDLGEVDLVLTSGTLPSTPDPLAFLSRLVLVKAKHLFITRTSFNREDSSIICLQSSRLAHNGPGEIPSGYKDRQVQYPLTLASKKKAEDIIRSAYDIRFQVVEDAKAYTVNGHHFGMYGYFCDIKR